jgi:hypothetical protein
MKHASRANASRALRGLSLVEVTIGTTVLFVLAAALTMSVASMKKLTVHGTVDTELQNMGQRAIADITRDLKHSGFASSGGAPYPYVGLLDGVPTGTSAAHFANQAHPAPTHTAKAGDPDFGPNREIVLLAPQFAEMKQLSNGTDIPVANAPPGGLTVTKIYMVPTIDANGNMSWDGVDYSYVVVTHNDGVNYLERRTNAANPVVIAHHVERVEFATNAEDLFNIPLNAVRARVWFRQRDDNGRVHRAFAEAMVALRNG